MIYQLPDGRIVELSVETYLELSDSEIQELNGLSVYYTKSPTHPWYSPFNSPAAKAAITDMIDESEIELPDIDTETLMNDDYFHHDDE